MLKVLRGNFTATFAPPRWCSWLGLGANQLSYQSLVIENSGVLRSVFLSFCLTALPTSLCECVEYAYMVYWVPA